MSHPRKDRLVKASRHVQVFVSTLQHRFCRLHLLTGVFNPLDPSVLGDYEETQRGKAPLHAPMHHGRIDIRRGLIHQDRAAKPSLRQTDAVSAIASLLASLGIKRSNALRWSTLAYLLYSCWEVTP